MCISNWWPSALVCIQEVALIFKKIGDHCLNNKDRSHDILNNDQSAVRVPGIYLAHDLWYLDDARKLRVILGAVRFTHCLSYFWSRQKRQLHRANLNQ